MFITTATYSQQNAIFLLPVFIAINKNIIGGPVCLYSMDCCHQTSIPCI